MKFHATVIVSLVAALAYGAVRIGDAGRDTVVADQSDIAASNAVAVAQAQSAIAASNAVAVATATNLAAQAASGTFLPLAFPATGTVASAGTVTGAQSNTIDTALQPTWATTGTVSRAEYARILADVPGRSFTRVDTNGVAWLHVVTNTTDVLVVSASEDWNGPPVGTRWTGLDRSGEAEESNPTWRWNSIEFPNWYENPPGVPWSLNIFPWLNLFLWDEGGSLLQGGWFLYKEPADWLWDQANPGAFAINGGGVAQLPMTLDNQSEGYNGFVPMGSAVLDWGTATNVFRLATEDYAALNVTNHDADPDAHPTLARTADLPGLTNGIPALLPRLGDSIAAAWTNSELRIYEPVADGGLYSSFDHDGVWARAGSTTTLYGGGKVTSALSGNILEWLWGDGVRPAGQYQIAAVADLAGYVATADIPGPGCTDISAGGVVAGATSAHWFSSATNYTLSVSESAPRYTYSIEVLSTNAATFAEGIELRGAWTPSGTNLVVIAPSTGTLWRAYGRAF